MFASNPQCTRAVTAQSFVAIVAISDPNVIFILHDTACSLHFFDTSTILLVSPAGVTLSPTVNTNDLSIPLLPAATNQSPLSVIGILIMHRRLHKCPSGFSVSLCPRGTTSLTSCMKADVARPRALQSLGHSMVHVTLHGLASSRDVLGIVCARNRPRETFN